MTKGNPYRVSKGKQEGGRYTSPTGQSSGTPSIDQAASKFGKNEQRLADLRAKLGTQAVQTGAKAKGVIDAVRKGAGLPESQAADIKMTAGSGGSGSKPPIASFDKVDQLPKSRGIGATGGPGMGKGTTEQVKKLIAALEGGLPHATTPGHRWEDEGTEPGFSNEPLRDKIQKGLDEKMPAIKADLQAWSAQRKLKLEKMNRETAERGEILRQRDAAAEQRKILKQEIAIKKGQVANPRSQVAVAAERKAGAKLNLTKQTQNMVPLEEEQRLAGIGYWEANRDKYMVGPKKDRFDQHALVADLKAQGYTEGPVMDRIVGHAAMKAWDKPDTFQSTKEFKADIAAGRPHQRFGPFLEPGAKAVISEGSGIDSGKQVEVVNRNLIKTDGRGIPTNVSGAYQPVDWKKEVAIRLPNGELGTMFKDRLSPVKSKFSGESALQQKTKAAEQRKEPPTVIDHIGKAAAMKRLRELIKRRSGGAASMHRQNIEQKRKEGWAKIQAENKAKGYNPDQDFSGMDQNSGGSKRNK